MKSSKSTSIIVLVVVIAALAASAYFYNQYKTEQKRAAELLGNVPSADPQKEVASLVEKVGKLYQLPSGEVPTVATVSDVGKLQGQPFFASAQNGDRVLIYSNAKKAILYRPETNKIIEVGPVNLGPTTDPLITGEGSTASKSATAISPTSPPVRVAIYNGTTKAGLTRIAENKLKETEKTVQITARTNAGVTTYEKTIVIDLSGKNKPLAQKYATLVGGTVGALPKDEAKPEDTDLLIILGADYE